MKITGLSHLKWENLHNWWLTKYFFSPLYVVKSVLLSVITVPLRSYAKHFVLHGYWSDNINSK